MNSLEYDVTLKVRPLKQNISFIDLKNCFHDLNQKILNKFDTFFAVPQERYGFSNNAPVFFGPPSFEEASFFVKDEEMVKIEINLR